ncbi:hypothetical protein Nepgr_018384 [Nepenthes gracilis]|uniref:Uncharacterized protein n=1 Tax=Nepenthes gracilis TaxID=150966 RepID=A0AAD3XTD5_NEPGR|nr:hypothetical protein Nepgr_018384 [Nepenthes gracilis]
MGSENLDSEHAVMGSISLTHTLSSPIPVILAVVAAARCEGNRFHIAGMARIVVIFDFDRTIIDGDSDNWVVTQMSLIQLFHQLLPTMSWNSLMNRMLEELHLQGKTTEDIAQCLKRTPLPPPIISAIKSAFSIGCDLRIVSDANQFFIETILKHHGLLSCFKEIITNPTFIDEEGRLRIIPYHDFRSSPHGCNLCPPNMCKGLIVEQIQASASTDGNKTLIYLGDGKGDYCPSLKLREVDHVMPREKFPLWERIHDNPMLVKAKVHGWSSGEELEMTLLRVISTILANDCNANCDYILTDSSDCKVRYMPPATLESSPQTPPTHH